MSNQVLPNAGTAGAKPGAAEQADQRSDRGSDLTAAAGAQSAGFWAIIDRQSRVNRLEGVSQRLFYGGVVALAVLGLSTLLTWVNLSQVLGPLSLSQSVSGVQTTPGAFVLLLTIGTSVFLGITFFNKKELFLPSVYTAAGWGAVGFLYVLWKVLQLGAWAGIGLYLAVLAAIGVGACFGFLAVRLKK